MAKATRNNITNPRPPQHTPQRQTPNFSNFMINSATLTFRCSSIGRLAAVVQVHSPPALRRKRRCNGNLSGPSTMRRIEPVPS